MPGDVNSAATRRKLTVAMIARDAARLIPASLKEISGLADEIVVVDTGSSDDTTNVARELGASVYSFHWNDDFSAARNYALTKACGDWIFWLDAGESVTDVTSAKLRQFLESSPSPENAYLVFIELPPSTSGGMRERVGRVRLMPNRNDLVFEGRVGERLEPAIAAAGMSVKNSEFVIERTARDHGEQIKRARGSRNLGIIQQEIEFSGPTPRRLVILGEAYDLLNEKPKAAQAFREAIHRARPESLEMLEAYYGLLTTFGESEDEDNGQLTACVEALEVFPFDAQLLSAMGSYLQARERIDLAERAYRSAYQYGQFQPETWHLPEMPQIAAACVAICLQLQDKNEEAVRMLEEATKRFPGSERIRLRLIDLYVQERRLDDALMVSRQLSMQFPHVEAFRSAIRGACQAVEGQWIPALTYLQTAHSAGCRTALCLRWLSVTLLALGSFEPAEAILDQWQELEPNNGEIPTYLRHLDEMKSQAASGTGQPARSSAGVDDRHYRVDEASGAPQRHRGAELSPSSVRIGSDKTKD